MGEFMKNRSLQIATIFALVAALILGFVLGSARLDKWLSMLVAGLFVMAFLPSYLLLYFHLRKLSGR